MIDLARRHEAEQRPGGLRRRALLALAARLIRPVGRAVLAPAAVGALARDQPVDRATDHRRLLVDARGVERAQRRPRAVDIIGAPAAEPGAVLLLLAPQISNAGGERLVLEAELRQETHAAGRHVGGRRI